MSSQFYRDQKILRTSIAAIHFLFLRMTQLPVDIVSARSAGRNLAEQVRNLIPVNYSFPVLHLTVTVTDRVTATAYNNRLQQLLFFLQTFSFG
jgi:hypothetical protein